MASEDVVGKSRGDTAVTTIVNLAEEAKLAREGVKAPGHQILTICKSLVAGGVAGGVFKIRTASSTMVLFRVSSISGEQRASVDFSRAMVPIVQGLFQILP
ncbi:Mitochondrial adenine nucleotide transporter ADNT1 [Zea mays]|uniref:Uncharacterized protein n=2 Tax=Zea mays TaxID=4577 RepID=A0A1D6MEF1_MAIZE|nr:hypothetical protein ZEAMMB73_Zm00001d039200 [Zea mays]PWZ19258.1 Mitochondrial adenine nucleotide transporter ADNT1 [Zea mays]